MVKNASETLLLTRPYSFISIVTIVILANFLAVGTFSINYALFKDIFLGLIMWIAAVFFAEALDIKKGNIREFFRPHLSILIFILLGAYSLLIYPLAIIFIGMIAIAVLIYSFKNKDTILSQFLFPSRGFVEVGIFAFIFVLHTNSIGALSEFSALIMAIYFLTLGRNLIGDLRDAGHDVSTFPVEFGRTATDVLIVILFLFAMWFSPSFLVFYPLIVMIFFVVVSIHSYTLHRLGVILSHFFLLNYLAYYINDSFLIIFLMLMTILLNMTYVHVPRHSNVDAPRF